MAVEWWEYLVPILFLPVAYMFSHVAIWILVKLQKLTTKTKSTLDDRVINNMRRPIQIIFVFIALYFAVQYLYIDLRPGIGNEVLYESTQQLKTIENGVEVIKEITTALTLGEATNTVFLVLGILIATYTLSKIVNAVFAWYLSDVLKGAKKRRQTIFRFSQNIITFFLYVIALLVILSGLKIDVTPMIAGLGIGGIAIAFAAQDTLSNFFAGFYLASDQPIRVGDFIKLSKEQRGYVEEVGWRNTKIRTVENNIMIIPNATLADSVITNFERPKPDISFWVPLGVSYSSDLDKVEKVTLKVAKDLLKTVKGGSPTFEPYMRYKEFGDSSINMSVGLACLKRGDKYVLTHEFIKRLKRAYDKEGIEIPFPQRDVYLRRE